MKKIYYLVFVTMIWIDTEAQTITSFQTGDWNNTATWVGGVVPGTANDVVIAAGHTVTFNISSATVLSITVNNGGIFNLSALNALTVTQDLVNNGTINKGGTSSLRIANNILNNGAITGAGNSVVTVGGTSLQNAGSLQSSFLYCSTPTIGVSNTALVIDGGGIFTIVNLLIQKSAGGSVTVNVPLVLTGSLNLGGGVGGRLILNNSDLQSNGFAGGGGSSTYIITNGTGRVIFSGGVNPKFFPVGTAASYSPVTIANGNTSTHAFGLRVSETFTSPPASTAVVNREWDIDDITGGANVDISFQWPGSAEGGGFNRVSCAVLSFDGTNWIPVTGFASATGANPYTRTATGVTTFTPFIIGSSGSFPIISAQTGNWNSVSTWTGGIIPSTADNVTISSGHTIDFDLPAATVNSVGVNNTGVLQLNTGNILTTTSNVSNSGTIRLNTNSSLRVGATLTNSSTINTNAGATNTLLSVAGNIVNSAGSITAESLYFSSINLGGNTTAQVVTSNNSLLNFSNVQLYNNGVNITLNTSLNTSNLSFNGTTGNLILESNYTLMVSGTITGADIGKYIQTNGTSIVIRSGAASPKFFPVGTAGSYTPLTISNGNVASHNFTVRVSDAFSSPPYNNSVVHKEWNISAVPGGANVDLTFQWNAGDEDATFDRSQSYVGRYAGGQWSPVSSPAPASGNDPYMKTVTAVANFSPFSVGSGGALPVHLLKFSALKQGSVVKLLWKVTDELNFSHYTVERSNDGIDYQILQNVISSNTPGIREYNISDSPSKGIYFYRLKMVDIGGSFTYSHVVKVDMDKKFTIMLFPNPAVERISVQNLDKFVMAEIISNSGNIIRQIKLTKESNSIDVLDLPAGLYILRLISADATEAIRFLKAK